MNDPFFVLCYQVSPWSTSTPLLPKLGKGLKKIESCIAELINKKASVALYALFLNFSVFL